MPRPPTPAPTPSLSFALSLAALVALAGGCPKPGAGGQAPPPPSIPAAGCPSAAGVYVASYLAPDDDAGAGSAAPAGAPSPGADARSYTGWVLPLHDRVVDSLDGVPEYATIDAAAAEAAGVPPPPPNVWLMTPGAPPCKPTIGAFYAAAIDAPTKNIAYGVELAGCAAPPDPDASTIALASTDAPTGCKIAPPAPAAERLGEPDQDGRWQRPTKETPIPPAFAAVVPPRTCAPPGCETLWSIAKVEVGGQPVAWAGAVNWVEIPAAPADASGAPAAPAASTCDWKVDAFSGFFVARADGSLAQITDGQPSPRMLTAVLADAGGPRVLLAAGPGAYTAYDLGGGAATVGRQLTWLIPHPDALTGLDRLVPECE